MKLSHYKTYNLPYNFEYYYDSNDLIHGESKQFYGDKLWYINFYKNNKLDGEQLKY